MALLMVCATFPLIWLGGLVTTYEAGMAVEDWPTTYGYNLFLYPLSTWFFGPWDLFIEHGHRLLAATVGILAIVQCFVFWRRENRAWVQWLALAALAAVIFQGLLGGLRVRLNERLLAQIHGSFGPLFFALCVTLAGVTSRWWADQEMVRAGKAGRKIRQLAIITLFLAYLQILLGASIRHIAISADPSQFRALFLFHLIIALALTGHIAMLWLRVVRGFRQVRLISTPTMVLATLITIQLLLGIGTWGTNYGWPIWLHKYHWAAAYVVKSQGMTQALVTTAHQAVGSLVLSVALVVTLRSFRRIEAPPGQLTSSALLAGVMV